MKQSHQLKLDGKDVLEVGAGGWECEITQENKKVKGLGNVAGLPSNTMRSLVVMEHVFL